LGDLNPGTTFDINHEASVRLAAKAKDAGVSRFIFSSSCSNYGAAGDDLLDENAEFNPVTPYGESKVMVERDCSAMADDSFSPTYLRNATAYGHSPMLRIDLVVNNLLGSALAYNEIRIMSDGTPWRPLIHCRDIAHAFVAFMDAPREAIQGKAVNIGGNAENYQVKQVADLVHGLMPDTNISYTGETGEDPRSYRVKFDLLKKVLPSFQLQYTLASGMEELYRQMVDYGFGKEDFEGDQFVRLRTLQHRPDRFAAVG
jgi:nucleoside-diphosphate-sugar epimerase